MIPQRAPDLPRTAFVILTGLLPLCAQALPEDAQQKVDATYESMDLFLDEGLVIYTGSTDKPTCINQGTLQVCGAEIRLERAENGTLNKVTATGAPARYQQKPATDQEIVHASGNTLVFDNAAQLVTADGDAEFSQASTSITAQHIEYDLKARRASADGTDGQQGQMITTPAAAGN